MKTKCKKWRCRELAEPGEKFCEEHRYKPVRLKHTGPVPPIDSVFDSSTLSSPAISTLIDPTFDFTDNTSGTSSFDSGSSGTDGGAAGGGGDFGGGGASGDW